MTETRPRRSEQKRTTGSRGNGLTRDARISLAYVYLFAAPFDIVATPVGVTLPTLVGLALVLVAATYASTSRISCACTIAAASYAGLALASLLHGAIGNPNPPTFSQAFAFLLSGLVVLVLASAIRIPLQVEKGIAAVAWGSLGLLVLNTFFEFGTSLAARNVGSLSRVGLLGADENISALYLALGAISWLWISLRRGFGLFVTYLALIGPAFLLGILATGSRTGIFAIALGLTAMCVIVRNGRAATIWIGAAAGLASAFRSGLLPPRLEEVLRDPLGTQAESVRTEIHDLYWQAFGEWWLIGVGSGEDARFLDHRYNLYFKVHNTALRLWVELGLLGIVCILLLVAALTVSSLRRPIHPWSVSCAAVLLLFGTTLGGLETSGLVVAVAALVMSRERPVDDPITDQVNPRNH